MNTLAHFYIFYFSVVFRLCAHSVLGVLRVHHTISCCAVAVQFLFSQKHVEGWISACF